MRFVFSLFTCLLPFSLGAVDPKDLINDTIRAMATTYNRYKKGEVKLDSLVFNDEKAALEFLINLLDPSDEQKTQKIIDEFKRFLEALDYYDLRWRGQFWKKTAAPLFETMKKKFSTPAFLGAARNNQATFKQIYDLFVVLYERAFAGLDLVYFYYFEGPFLQQAANVFDVAFKLEGSLIKAGLIENYSISGDTESLRQQVRLIFGSDSEPYQHDFGFGKKGLGITFVLENLGEDELVNEYLSILASVVTNITQTPEVLRRQREILKHLMPRIVALNEKLKDRPEVQGYIKMRTVDGKSVKTIPLYRWALDILMQKKAEKEVENLKLMLAQLDVELSVLRAQIGW